MAGWIYFVLLLIPQLQAQVNNDCGTPWNFTYQYPLYVTWDGDDRSIDVHIEGRPDPKQNGCSWIKKIVPFNQRKLQLDPLCSNKTYFIDGGLICADGSIIQNRTFTIQTDYVEAPPEVTILEVSNTTIKLEWSEPYSDAEIIAYEAGVVVLGDTWSLTTSYHTVNKFFEFENLKPYTEYGTVVSAKTHTTIGPKSEMVLNRTQVGTPFSPKDLVEDEVTNSSIVVSWNEPEPSTGPISFYEIRWKKNDSASLEYETDYVFVNFHKIDRLNPYTEYSIQVRASTDAGAGPWSSVLNVFTAIGIPSIPTSLTALNKSESTILLSWNAPEPANGPSLEYLVSWGMKGSGSSLVYVDNITEHLFIELKPFTEYVFQVSAGTSAGFGPYTKPLVVRTLIGLPSQPLNLTETDIRNTSITIEWASPEFPNGPILDYVIQVLERPNGTISEQNTTENSTTLENLKPCTLYVIRVGARTEAGVGPFSEDLQVETSTGVTGPLTNVSYSANATSITIIWEPPELVPGVLLDYHVSWGVQGTPSSLVVLDNMTHHYDAVGLRPYTEYQFNIAARTEAGVGIAETFTIRTDIAAPSSPRELSVAEKHDTSILLVWLPPEHPNGPDLIYSVRWVDAANGSSTLETNSTSSRISNLKPSTSYSIAVIAQTQAGNGSWSEILNVTTSDKIPSKNSHLVLALVLGIMLPLLIVLLIVGYIIARKKGIFDDFMTRSREPSQEMQPPRLNITKVSNEKLSRSYTVHNFIEKMNTITRYGHSGFHQEFEELKNESPQNSTNAAKIEENLIKNRWVKILPFDHSRVKIYPEGTANRSNFINANYIPGESHILEYIATQGPLPNTVNDFWTMVWQQSVPIVVMLTQCVERAVKNCERYWPASGESKLYGDIQVQTKQETILTSHVMRLFLVQYQNQQRHIVHMHFTNWPVSGTPRNPVDFLHFIRLVRDQVSERRPGPILVHCSAGVGRTGTFLAVDRLMQHLQTKDDIDIYNTVLDIRRYRPHMVQSMEQYVFIYSCVEQLIQDANEPEENIYDTIA